MATLLQGCRTGDHSCTGMSMDLLGPTPMLYCTCACHPQAHQEAARKAKVDSDVAAREALHAAILDLCHDYGITSTHTRELLDQLIDSIEVED